MDAPTLRSLIQTTLQSAPRPLYDKDAEELLVATCAQESHLGQYRQQINGPALGIFQMEPEDCNDIWANYLHYNGDLASWVRGYQKLPILGSREIITNDQLAIALARVHYLRAPGALPSGKDLAALYAYYKAHYNTPQGAATWPQFRINYGLYAQGTAV